MGYITVPQSRLIIPLQMPQRTSKAQMQLRDLAQ